ncbi:hypothetical protein RCH18_000229 [Flavobacterium sp. PL11]|uniref:hypothetical protein n=1 Tax=Flavobacterium sp. PL11 TaxID=3071717 RepID=UPI002E04166B|nr:hypothetical protein [Flavobacterium sp. PL11]
MFKYLYLSLFTIVFFFSCNLRDKPAIAFYYWKTNFKLSQSEIDVLENNNVKKLYIRYFDIDLDAKNQPYPLAPIHFQTKTNNYTIVPVIYIKNKVMLNKATDVNDLAKKTIEYIIQINNKNKINIQEIQIDCDWTLASREQYLQFIETFKKVSNKKLSATIRLHQIKYYTKTKIPAVDKGVLMYYNMGVIAADSLNSIYDKNIADRYLKSLENYPLQLDIALPIYSWGVHIRDQQVIGLRNKILLSEFKKDSNFAFNNKNYFRVKYSNYKNGRFYKSNDIVKLERISRHNLIEMASDLREHLKKTPQEIIFYDLDELNLKDYEKNIFEHVIARF